MNLKLVCKVVGRVLLIEACALALPLLVALIYRESPLPYLLSMAVTAGAGFLLSRVKTTSRYPFMLHLFYFQKPFLKS